MIAVDTSALMAILLDEPLADACAVALIDEPRLLISAGTMVETAIVGIRRGLGADIALLFEGFDFEIVNVTAASSRRIAEAYQRWGKGMHPAGLNFGDCFAYDVARQQDCALLYVGRDFAQTDVASVL